MRRCWLALANCLSCVGEKEAWIFSEEVSSAPNGSTYGHNSTLGKAGFAKNGKERRVVTLEEIRKGYQEELDRVEAVSAGRFAFGVGEVGRGALGEGDAMDVL